MAALCISYRKIPWRDRLLGGSRVSSCAPMAELLVLLLGRCRRALGSLVAAIGGATTAARRRRCVCIVPRNRRRTNLHIHARRPKFGPKADQPIRTPYCAEPSTNQERRRSRDIQIARGPHRNRSKATSAPFISEKVKKLDPAAAHNFPPRKDSGGAKGQRPLHLFRRGSCVRPHLFLPAAWSAT